MLVDHALVLDPPPEAGSSNMAMLPSATLEIYQTVLDFLSI